MPKSKVQILFKSKWGQGKSEGKEIGRGVRRKKEREGESERERETDYNHHHGRSCSVSPGPFPYGPLSGGIPRVFFWRYNFRTTPGIQKCTRHCPNLEWHVCKQILPSPQFAMMGIFVYIDYPASPGLASSHCCVCAFPTIGTVEYCQVC